MLILLKVRPIAATYLKTSFGAYVHQCTLYMFKVHIISCQMRCRQTKKQRTEYIVLRGTCLSRSYVVMCLVVSRSSAFKKPTPRGTKQPDTRRENTPPRLLGCRRTVRLPVSRRPSFTSNVGSLSPKHTARLNRRLRCRQLCA